MISLVLAAVLMSSQPAAAETAQPAPAAAPAAPAAANVRKAGEKDRDTRICRTEPVLGSRMTKRVCATKGEWDDRRQEDRDMIDKSQRNKPLLGE